MTLSLKLKFLLAGALLTLALCGYILVIQSDRAQIGTLMRRVLSGNLAAMQTASEIKHSFVLYDDLIFRFVATGDPALLKEGDRVKKRALIQIGQLKTISGSVTVRGLLGNLEKESAQYFRDVEKLIHTYYATRFPGEKSVLKAIAWAMKDDKGRQSMSLLSAEGRSRLTRIYSLCESLVDLNRVQMEDAQKEVDLILEKTGRNARRAGAAVFFGAMLIGALLMVSILGPIRSLLSGVKRVTEGDLQFEIPSPGTDEIGDLTQAFNSMTRNLRLKHQQLLEETVTDELTRVPNLRYFHQVFKNEIERARRHQRSLSLLMLDVDLFKQYNDAHGHEMGNVILREVAQALKENLRPGDTLARYGGEEFAVLLVEADREQAEAAAERLRKAIETCRFPGQETQPGGKITVSLGGACFPRDAEVAQGLIEKADQALYSAKKAGRNRVHWTS